MPLNLSCPDWFERLKAGKSIVPEIALNIQMGERAVAAFNKLRLADVPGTPTLEDAGADWFRNIVRALFASLDPVTGERAIREFFCLVPKKNSKTTNGSLLMLVALILNQRPSAQFFLCGPVQDTADLAFAQAAGAIRLDKFLSDRFHVREHVKTIVDRVTRAELQIITFDPAVVTGVKPAGVLIDELHVIAKFPKAASALRQIRGGMLPFPEAFLGFITTQSEERPVGVFKAELVKARAIRDGKRTGATLPVLYEFPEHMQRSGEWEKPENWPLVTPNAGRSIRIERLVEAYAEAKQTDEAERRAWASQHLNVEIGLALHSDGWAGADYWEAATEPGLTLDAIIERCDVITAGIDGGGLDDLLALAFCGRDAKTKNWLLWVRGWAFEKVLERRKEIASRLLDFQADGELLIVQNLGMDIVDLVRYVAKVDATGKLAKVGLDPAGIGAIVDALAEIKVKDERVVGIPQGWKLNGAILTAERKLADGTLLHCGQELAAWCVGNAKVEPKGNAITITKQAAGRAKIDALMASFNALALMATNPAPPRKVIQQGLILA